MHAQRLTQEFLNKRDIGFAMRQGEVCKRQVCSLERAGQRADVVAVWRGDAERELLCPQGVHVARLLLACRRELRVGPDQAVVAVEEGVVAVPCFGAVFCFGDVVPALSVAAEEEDFVAFSGFGGGGQSAYVALKAWPYRPILVLGVGGIGAFYETKVLLPLWPVS